MQKIPTQSAKMFSTSTQDALELQPIGFPVELRSGQLVLGGGSLGCHWDKGATDNNTTGGCFHGQSYVVGCCKTPGETNCTGKSASKGRHPSGCACCFSVFLLVIQTVNLGLIRGKGIVWWDSGWWHGSQVGGS